MKNKPTQVNITVICINDSYRPAEIPINKWITKGHPYTIKEFIINNIQNRLVGVKLHEINIDDCIPYTNFALTRFGMPSEQLYLEAENAITKLIEESIEVKIPI